MSDNNPVKTDIFIIYAREDSVYAEKLYNELKKRRLNPWMDKRNLFYGQNWQKIIEDEVKKSRYFIPIFSSSSVKKIGYVQNEFKYALKVLCCMIILKHFLLTF